MVELATADTAEAVLDVVRHQFGADAELYAIDHAYRELVSVAIDDDTSIDLEGDLRIDLLARRSHRRGDRWFTPLCERQQPLFVIVSSDDPGPDMIAQPVVAMVMSVLRTRFELLERSRRRSQMSVAAELQWDLLPLRADHGEGHEVAALLEPAYDVAGDLFDYAFDDGLWVYSLDAMGHGVDATACGTIALAAIRNARRQGHELKVQFDAAGDAVRRFSGERAFVTAVGCRLRPDEPFEVVNAGHEPLRIVAGRRVERMSFAADPPLGVTWHDHYRRQTGPTLAENDGLVMFSDGAANARRSGGAVIGRDRLDAMLERAWSDVPLLTVHDTLDGMLAEITGDIGDDVTMLALRRVESDA